MPDKYTIVISCVTTETVMVSSPVIHYQADEVHLFHYIRDPGTAKAQLYEDHYNETCRQIRESLPQCRITEHTDAIIYDFASMTRSLGRLYAKMLEEHPDAMVYANFSSGPSEFIASLGIFSFLNPEVKLFKVSTKSFTLDTPEYRLLYYDENGKPVGLSREVYPPKPVPSVKLDAPDEILVRSLRIYNDFLQRGERPLVPEMQKVLEEKGLWVIRHRANGGRSGEGTLDRNNFYRNYSDVWKILGWIEDKDLRDCPKLTEEGEAVIELFWTE
jgi:hypothetical protein